MSCALVIQIDPEMLTFDKHRHLLIVTGAVSVCTLSDVAQSLAAYMIVDRLPEFYHQHMFMRLS